MCDPRALGIDCFCVKELFKSKWVENCYCHPLFTRAKIIKWIIIWKIWQRTRHLGGNKSFLLDFIQSIKIPEVPAQWKNWKDLWYSYKLSENLNINSVVTDGLVCARTLAFSMNPTFKRALGHVPRTQVEKSLVSGSINGTSSNSEIVFSNSGLTFYFQIWGSWFP